MEPIDEGLYDVSESPDHDPQATDEIIVDRPRSQQSIFTGAQVNLQRFSVNIRYWSEILDYHSVNLSRYCQCLGTVILSLSYRHSTEPMETKL